MHFALSYTNIWLKNKFFPINLFTKCSKVRSSSSPGQIKNYRKVINQLFTQRMIRIGGTVDDEMTNFVVAQLLYLDSFDYKKLNNYLHEQI